MTVTICTEIKLACPKCATVYKLEIKQDRQVNSFRVECECGQIVTEKDEVKY